MLRKGDQMRHRYQFVLCLYGIRFCRVQSFDSHIPGLQRFVKGLGFTGLVLRDFEQVKILPAC